MEWSNDLILEFLELYRGEPAIWNPKDPQHKNRSFVHDAWKRIETNLSVECSVVDLKRKKDALMATFRKLFQKVKATSGNGTRQTDEVYKPDWFAYNYMNKFLHGLYTPRTATTSTSSEFQAFGEGDTETIENDDEVRSLNENVWIKEEDESFIVTPSASITKSANPSANQDFNVRDKGKKRKAHGETHVEEAYHQAFTKFTEPESTTSDECSLYGELLAIKLRNLDPDLREIAMLEIDHLMYRMKHQKNYTPRTTFS